MRVSRFSIFCGLGFFAVASTMVAQDELPPQPKSGGKVCVATLENASTSPAFVERLTDRLTKSLKQNKINAVIMESRTTDKYPLELSTENGEESKQKECDYVLLSQIHDPRQHPFEPQAPEISIGRRPSIDASDPMEGSSGPVHRENLELAFALFRIGRFKPVLDSYVQERPSANASISLFPAMDEEANRVGHKLKK